MVGYLLLNCPLNVTQRVRHNGASFQEWVLSTDGENRASIPSSWLSRVSASSQQGSRQQPKAGSSDPAMPLSSCHEESRSASALTHHCHHQVHQINAAGVLPHFGVDLPPVCEVQGYGQLGQCVTQYKAQQIIKVEYGASLVCVSCSLPPRLLHLA